MTIEEALFLHKVPLNNAQSLCPSYHFKLQQHSHIVNFQRFYVIIPNAYYYKLQQCGISLNPSVAGICNSTTTIRLSIKLHATLQFLCRQGLTINLPCDIATNVPVVW